MTEKNKIFKLSHEQCEYMMLFPEPFAKRCGLSLIRLNPPLYVYFSGQRAKYKCYGQFHDCDVAILDSDVKLLELDVAGNSGGYRTWLTQKFLANIRIEKKYWEEMQVEIESTFIEMTYDEDEKLFVIKVKEEYSHDGALLVEFGYYNIGLTFYFVKNKDEPVSKNEEIKVN